ncbi:MAG: hypothetical protein OXG79_04715 [Chloroflexi bacterium]|nr:hypothetical protein [Chloroflexota bacterium]
MARDAPAVGSELLRRLEIRGPVSIGGGFPAFGPTPDLAVIERTIPAPEGGPGQLAGDVALSSDNPCTQNEATGNDVHHTRTKWCYDGTNIVATPKEIKIQVWGSFHWWFEGLIFMTRVGTPQDIWTVSGGYGQSHYQDKSHVRIQEQQYWIGTEDPEAVCIRFNSYIQKKQYGNGNKGSPKVTTGAKSFC